MRRVVITGVGVLAPSGIGIQDFWKSCIEQKSSIQSIPEHWLHYHNYKSSIWSPLGDINFSKYELSRMEQRQSDMVQLLALSATFEALKNANLEIKLNDPRKNSFIIPELSAEKSGVSFGVGMGGMSTYSTCQNDHILKPLSKMKPQNIESKYYNDITNEIEPLLKSRYNPFAVTMTMPNACSSSIGIKYGLNGANNTYCSACASGTVAVGKGYQSIKSGYTDFMITGGADYLNDGYGGMFRGFDIAGTLVRGEHNPEKSNRPFDKDRSGFLFAEGGASTLILEEYDHAVNRGAKIIAEIVGFNETFDAYNIMSLDPEGVQIERLFLGALKDAGISSRQIDYINTHGTGTIVNDEVESKLIEKVFGKNPYITATKSITGHTIGASGAIEAALTALSLSKQTVTGCKNLENPIRQLNFVTETKHTPMTFGVSNSFAFGGHNAALIFKAYT